jgi:hypothetical protein
MAGNWEIKNKKAPEWGLVLMCKFTMKLSSLNIQTKKIFHPNHLVQSIFYDYYRVLPL